MSLSVSLTLGFVLSSLIGLAAYWRGSLTRGGVLGAILTGTAIFGMGGFLPGLLLVAFFASSSFLSHFHARSKQRFSDMFEKGARRDLRQALANGGWAALLAIAYGLIALTTADPRAELLLFAALVGALAAVTADTWATELGVLSARAPRMITTGRTVPAGTSGGITLLGTLAAVGGGAFIGAVLVAGAFFVEWVNPFVAVVATWDRLSLSPMTVALILSLSALSGLGGALFDSFLGATVQSIYFCEYDEQQTEKKVHTCGRKTRRVRGWLWLDNDVVNFAASVAGSLVALAGAGLAL
jgi:uncharacterized protein (TIGR00297 family)